MAVNRWSREQLIVAFALYCQTPFGKMHKTNPEIVRTAKLLGRTPSSLAMKLVNFASLDPAITKTGRKGLGNAAADDKRVWNEFHADWEQLALQSANIVLDLGVAAGLHEWPGSAVAIDCESHCSLEEGSRKSLESQEWALLIGPA